MALLSATGQRLAGGARTADRHSANLLRLCHEALTAAGVTVAGLGAIACGSGPGSFTGLRVGLAVAKGLALPFDLPLLQVSSLAALARDLAAVAPNALLVPCLDAGKGEVYGQLHRAGTPLPDALGPELRLAPEAYAARVAEAASGGPIAVGGSGLDRHADAFRMALGEAALRLAFPGPSAESVGAIGLIRLQRGERDELASVVPAYGRPPDITVPRRKP